MNERERKLTGVVFFWVAALVPFAVIFLTKDHLAAFWFISLLLIYALIYRPMLHIFRLMHLKVIAQKDAWKFFIIPFYGAKYMKVLWLG